MTPSQSPSASAGDPFALTRTAAGHMPMTADVIPRGNIVYHGIRYSVSVIPALRWAVPSITSVAFIAR